MMAADTATVPVRLAAVKVAVEVPPELSVRVNVATSLIVFPAVIANGYVLVEGPVPVHVVVPVTTTTSVTAVTPVKTTDRAPAAIATDGVRSMVHVTVLLEALRTLEIDTAGPVSATGDVAAKAGAATTIDTAGAVQAAARMTLRREATRSRAVLSTDFKLTEMSPKDVMDGSGAAKPRDQRRTPQRAQREEYTPPPTAVRAMLTGCFFSEKKCGNEEENRTRPRFSGRLPALHGAGGTVPATSAEQTLLSGVGSLEPT